LTLIDVALLKRIDAEELLHKNFSKPEAAPNFMEMVEVFNKWSQWVPTEVLCRETATQRAELLTLFIKTANRCVAMNNFNTSCAILAGLGHPSITRLRSSWEKVKKKHLQKWKKLQDLFEMARNFSNYRAAERKAEVPFVPYLGILPKDLNSIEENNPNTVNGLINVRKLRLIWRVVRTLLRAQTSHYSFARTILYNYLQDMKVFGDDDVYELSKKLEPPKH